MTRLAQILGRLLLLAVALVAATVAIGWWGIAVAAFGWGVWIGRPIPRGAAEPWNWTGRSHNDRAIAHAGARRIAVAAALAWSSILVWTAVRGPLPALIRALGQIAGAPGSVLILATVLFPTLLAWSAATVGGAIAAYLDANRQSPIASR
jgi:hypothetical protein